MYQNLAQLPAALTDPAFDADRWLREQQLLLLYRHAPTAAIGSAFSCIILAVLLWPVVPRMPLLVWTGIGLVIALLRLLLSFARPKGKAAAADGWHHAYLGGLLASGLNWGVASVLLFPHDSVIHQAFITIVLAGITATSASVHAPARGGFLLFSVPALLPLALQFALQGTHTAWMMAAMVVVFLLVMTWSARETSRTIKHVLGLQVQNVELTRALHHQATHDSLVDLVNQGEFKRRLEALATVASIRREPYALVFVDLDLFKEVNDRGGHSTGDEMLRRIGAILKAKVRAHDTTARLGGDEFGILLARCPAPQALRIAQEIQQAICDFELHWAGQTFRVGASIGVAYTTAGEHDAETLLNAADAACYAAKEAGRNQVRMFHADPSFASTGRFQISGRFHLSAS